MQDYQKKRREVPPTAGLPILFSDLLPIKPQLSLADKLTKWLAIPSPIFTCSGTAALIVALQTLQKKQPNRTTLIVPAYTCPLVALTAFHCPSLKVVVCDLLPNSIDMDPQQLQILCNEQTLAIVVTHLAGRVADVATAKSIANITGCYVIEDAAQAMGAKNDGISVGLHGDIGFFSMAVGKGLTTFEGGVLFSKNPDLHTALSKTAQTLLPKKYLWEWRRCLELWAYAICYRPLLLWYAYGKPLRSALRKGNLLEAVGDDFDKDDIPLHYLGSYRQSVAAKSFKRLPDYLEQARQRALSRIAQLNKLSGLQVITDQHSLQQGVWPFIIVILPSPQLRDIAMQRLWGAGVGVTRLFINALPEYPAVKPVLITQNKTTNAIDFANRTLSISNSRWLDDATFTWILEQLQAVLSKR